MRKLNPDGTLKGYEFSEGYDPEAPPSYIPEGEDLIDFPCSPLFVRHFAYQGLTKDYPSSFYLDKKSLQPNEYNNNLYYNNRRDSNQIRELKGQVLFLQSKLNEHMDKAKKYKEDGF